MKKTLLIAALAALALGCNSTSQYYTSKDTNGVPFTMKAHTWNMLQADQSVGKIRINESKTTKGIGVTDVTQKSDMATAFEAVGGLAKDLAGAFASVNGAGAVVGTGGTVKTVVVTNTVAPPEFVDTNSATWPTTVKVGTDGKAVVCWPCGACVVVPVTSK